MTLPYAFPKSQHNLKLLERTYCKHLFNNKLPLPTVNRDHKHIQMHTYIYRHIWETRLEDLEVDRDHNMCLVSYTLSMGMLATTKTSNSSQKKIQAHVLAHMLFHVRLNKNIRQIGFFCCRLLSNYNCLNFKARYY